MIEKPKSRKYTLIELVVVLFFVVNVGTYCGNVFRLVTCDFEPSWKGEVCYAVGLFTPTYLVTAFLSLDD